MFALQVYVPISHVEKVKLALFAAGAGRIGNYDSCCWQTTGVGQFRPLLGSTPHIGQTDELEQVEEVKLELVCQKADLQAVEMALRQAHPYETPAFFFWPVFSDAHSILGSSSESPICNSTP